ncbi:hypothetical protein AS96_02560 [Microbacterium sp. MRS-1]|nr:hypothetical protein AS96_02560 [Microbacterium sp. MRS-1]
MTRVENTRYRHRSRLKSRKEVPDMIRMNATGRIAFAMRSFWFREPAGAVSFDAFRGAC